MPTVTFTQLKDRAKAYGYGSVDDSMIGVFLNQTYMEVAGSFKWGWLEKTSTITASAGVASTALPSDLQWFGRLQSQATGVKTPAWLDAMDYRSHAESRRYSTEQAAPRYFTLFEGSINWLPTPDASYTYRLYYWKAPTALSGASDTTLIPDVDVDVLVLGALQRWAMRENDMAKYQVYGAQFQASIAQMMRNEKAQQKQTIRRVPMPDHYLGIYDRD